jgi:hypothetical protein
VPHGQVGDGKDCLCVFLSLLTTLPLWWLRVEKVLRVKNITLLQFSSAADPIASSFLEVIRRWVMETAGINLFLMGLSIYGIFTYNNNIGVYGCDHCLGSFIISFPQIFRIGKNGKKYSI